MATVLERIKRDMKQELEEHEIICMADVEQEDVKWLWPGLIPLGKVTILQGDPGLGKTTFALQLAAIVSTGDSFPFVKDEDDEKMGAGNVIFQTAEDGLGDTIKTRLVEAWADCNRIFVIDESNEGLTLDDERLRDAIQTLRPRLVVIDPLQAYLGAHNMYKVHEMRPVFHQLGDLAAEFGCAIVLIGHLNKTQGTKTVYRSSGSGDIVAAVRSVLTVGEVPGVKYQRAVVHTKSNLAPKAQTILFDLDPKQGFQWASLSDLSAEEVLNGQNVRKEAPVRKGCEAFLKELLSNGPILAIEAMKATKANGFSEATVNRAKKALSIKTIKGKGDGKFFWALKDSDNKS